MYLLVAKKKSKIGFACYYHNENIKQFVIKYSIDNDSIFRNNMTWETWIEVEQEKMKFQAKYPDIIFSIISLKDILTVISFSELKKITKRLAILSISATLAER